MSKKGTDEIVVLLDTSGSMASQVKDVQGAFTSFIEEQQKVPGREASASLWTFNSPGRLLEEYVKRPLSNIKGLLLKPMGNTALLDAICLTIDRVGERLAMTPEESRPEKVIFLIITDGEENSSQRFTKQDVISRINHQKTHYQWIFQFVGPDPTLFHEAIPQHQTHSYDHRKIGSTYSVMSAAVRSSRIS